MKIKYKFFINYKKIKYNNCAPRKKAKFASLFAQNYKNLNMNKEFFSTKKGFKKLYFLL